MRGPASFERRELLRELALLPGTERLLLLSVLPICMSSGKSFHSVSGRMF